MSLFDRIPVPFGRQRRARTGLEVRGAKAANRHITWTSPGRPVLPEWGAEYAIRRLFYGSTFAYRCVQVRAHALAGLTPRVGPDPDRPDDHNPDAPLLQLLTNTYQGSWRTLASWSQAQLDVTGRLGWELVPADGDPEGPPIQVAALAAHRLDPIAAPRGSQELFSGFEYRVYDGDEDRKYLTRDEVFYVWRPKQDNWAEPESIFQAQRLNIETARMLETYHHAFLYNDARPAAAIVVHEFADEDDKEAFEDQWKGKYGGPRNAGKTHIVEAAEGANGDFDATKAMAVHTLGMNPRDAQMLDMYQEIIRAVTVGFGVPLSMLGDSSNRTFANAEQEERNFWHGTMLPLIRDFEAHINRELAPRMGDDRFWFDLSDVEALRAPSRIAVPGAREILGLAMTVNELRTGVLGLPAYTNDPAADLLPGLAQLGAPATATPAALPAPDTTTDAEQSPAGESPEEERARRDLTDRLDRLEAMLAQVAEQQQRTVDLPAPELRAIEAPALAALPGTVAAAPAAVAPVAVPAPVAAAQPEPAPVETARAAETEPEQRGWKPDPDPDSDQDDEEARAAREEQRRAAIWQAADNRWRSLETLWAASMREHFAEQAQSVDEKFTARARGRASRAAQIVRDMQQLHSDAFIRNQPAGVELRAFDIGRLFDPAFWRDRLARLARQLLAATWTTAGTAAAADLNTTFDLDTPDVQDAILARANQLSGQVTDTTYRRIQAALAEGVEAGEPVDQIAERVRAVFDQASEQRALVIARTEVVSASNAATEATARLLGEDVAAGLEWVATRDARTRRDHREIDGAIVPVGETFGVGDPPWPMRYPGDPTAPPHLTVQCRCALTVVTPDDMPRTGPDPDRLVDRDTAERLLALVADGIVRPEHITRVLEVAA